MAYCDDAVVPYRKLFISRWSAIFWAACVIYTSVDTVGFAPEKSAKANVPTSARTDIDGAPVTPEDVSNLNAIVNAL